MKKIILPLALLVGAAGAAHAQQGAFKYGIKGGFNASTYTGGGTIGTDTGIKPGFAAGLLANYSFTDNASIQLEAMYSQKGAFKDTYGTGTAAQKVKQYRSTLSYIDVPLLFKYTIGEAGKGFFFELGPQASFAAGSREFLRDQGAKVGSGNEEEIFSGVDRMVPFGVGYVGGLGYQITSGLGLGVRYTGDFTNVYKDGFAAGSLGNQGGSDNNFRNGVFQLQAHYLFGGK